MDSNEAELKPAVSKACATVGGVESRSNSKGSGNRQQLTNGKPALARWIGDVETKVGLV